MSLHVEKRVSKGSSAGRGSPWVPEGNSGQNSLLHTLCRQLLVFDSRTKKHSQTNASVVSDECIALPVVLSGSAGRKLNLETGKELASDENANGRKS